MLYPQIFQECPHQSDIHIYSRIDCYPLFTFKIICTSSLRSKLPFPVVFCSYKRGGIMGLHKPRQNSCEPLRPKLTNLSKVKNRCFSNLFPLSSWQWGKPQCWNQIFNPDGPPPWELWPKAHSTFLKKHKATDLLTYKSEPRGSEKLYWRHSAIMKHMLGYKSKNWP